MLVNKIIPTVPAGGYVPFRYAQMPPCAPPASSPSYYISITLMLVRVPLYARSSIGSRVLLPNLVSVWYVIGLNFFL